MKRKKIRIYAFVLTAAILIGTVSVYVKADDSTMSLMSALGTKFNKHAGVNNDSDEAVYARGKIGNITESEFEQAKDFYIVSGLSESEALSEAEKYTMEREALYQKAIQEGYGVSDEEIHAYLEELKSVMDSAANKDDVQALIGQFDSEEAYWEYQYKVYKKNLPIQNYVKNLESQFRASAPSTYDAEGVDDDAIGKQWNHYFEQLKKDMTEAEAFTVVN